MTQKELGIDKCICGKYPQLLTVGCLDYCKCECGEESAMWPTKRGAIARWNDHIMLIRNAEEDTNV